jgi:hypothetical protein
VNRDVKQGAGILGLGAAACVACCAGPIIAFVGGIAAVGAIGTMFVGLSALLVAAIAIAVVLVVRRRRPAACTTSSTPVAVEGPIRRHAPQR